MQYWLYAFKIGEGNIDKGHFDTLEQAIIEMDRLDRQEYEYADIIQMEWGKEPKYICGENFEYEKGKTLVKRLIKDDFGRSK